MTSSFSETRGMKSSASSLEEIVRDTEDSLQRVRLKLGATKAMGGRRPKSYAAAGSSPPSRPRPSSAPSFARPSFSKRPSLDRVWERSKTSRSSPATSSSREPMSLSRDDVMSPRAYHPDNRRPGKKEDGGNRVRFSLEGSKSRLHAPEVPSEVTPAMIGALMERLESQTETIALLGTALEKMEARNSNQESNVSHLEKQLETLGERVAERGVDVATETKMASWREAVTRELEAVDAKIDRASLETESRGLIDARLSAFERRLEESTRRAEEEKMAVRTVVQTLRRHVTNVETDVTEILKRQKKRSKSNSWN